MYLFTREQQELKETVRKFVQEEVIPVASELDRSGTFPAHLLKRCGTLGFTAKALTEQYGRFDAVSACIIMEELARGLGSLALTICPHYQVCDILQEAGSEELKNTVLPQGHSLDKLFAYALSEASGGSDALSIDTTAYCNGKEWVLNGSKMWITNAGVANGYLVAARTNTATRNRDVTLFYIDANTPGLFIEEREPLIGLNSLPHCTITMRDCRVPLSHLIGTENNGYRILKPTLYFGRLSVSAIALGIAKRALELSIQYATVTGKYGRTLTSYQGLSFMLAEMYSKITVCRSGLYHAASLYDLRSSKLSAEVAAVKLLTTEYACDICKSARQIHGANGLSKKYEVERCFRDVQTLTIAEGTSEICKNIISNVITSPDYTGL